MRMPPILLLVFAAGALAASLGSAAAQVPAGTSYVVGSNVPTHLSFLDRAGGVSSLLGSTAIGTGQIYALEDSPDNRSLVAYGTTSEARFYDKKTGVLTQIGLAAPGSAFPTDACHLGDGRYVTFLSQSGSTFVYRHDHGTYKNGRTFAFVSATPRAGCWDGSTGGVVMCDLSTAYFIDANGTFTNSVGGLSDVTGCDWSPWDGSIIVSRFGRSTATGLLRVTRAGQVTTIGPATTLMHWNACVEVRENPSEEYLSTDTGSSPNWVTATTPGGATTTLFATGGSNHFAATDIAYYDARNIWGDGAWVAGQQGKLFISFPSHGGAFYGIAMSFAHRPGLGFGQKGTLHVAPDSLFSLSLSQPAIFVNFSGVLDANGEPTAAPFVRIPPGLAGIRVYAAAAAFDQSDVLQLSNAWGITIE